MQGWLGCGNRGALQSMRLGQALPLGRSKMAFAQGTHPQLYDILAFSLPWGHSGDVATQGMCAQRMMQKVGKM